jgi:hypothetical protein
LDPHTDGRILVEGGPVDRRSKHLAAALSGFTVGVTVALMILFAVAIKAAHNAHESALAVARIQRQLATTAAHTRMVQRQGEPVAVCLRDALEGAAVLLVRIPSVERPLEAYLRLQASRYEGVRCPDER